MRIWRTWFWTIVVGLIGAALIHFTHRGPWQRHQIAGLAIGIPAYCLWALARAQLGHSFALRAKAHQLVTRGFYAKIRSPIYLFNGILLAALFVYLGAWYLFLLFLFLIPMQLKRIRNEERVLEETFGDEYRAYKLRTWL